VSVGQPQPTMVGHRTPAYPALHCNNATHEPPAALWTLPTVDFTRTLLSVYITLALLQWSNLAVRTSAIEKPSVPASMTRSHTRSNLDADAPRGADGARHRGVRAGLSPPPRCRGAAPRAVQRRVCRPRRRCCASTLLSNWPYWAAGPCGWQIVKCAAMRSSSMHESRLAGPQIVWCTCGRVASCGQQITTLMSEFVT
jgi:hypothetical protein